MTTAFDVDHARSHFRALRLDQSFMDNAGGSQILDTAADLSVRKEENITNANALTILAPGLVASETISFPPTSNWVPLTLSHLNLPA